MEPTYYGYIASTDDALLMFEACRLGILRRRKNRLCERERLALDTGCVYVWDESESGIRRWTDGKRWSPSRVNGCFLSYTELEPKYPELPGSLPEMQRSASDVPLDDGLIKKSLSLFTTENSKLHLMCYYRKRDVDEGRLIAPSQDPRLCEISIPRALYPDILPEFSRPVPPHMLPSRKRRLSGAPASIVVRGCSSLQQLPPQHQEANVYPHPAVQTAVQTVGDALAPVRHHQQQQQQQTQATSYHSLIPGDCNAALQSNRVNSAHTIQATSLLPNERKTVASPTSISQQAPNTTLPSHVPNPQACPNSTQVLAQVQAPASYRSFSNPTVSLDNSTATPPPSLLLMQSSGHSNGSSSLRRRTLQDSLRESSPDRYSTTRDSFPNRYSTMRDSSASSQETVRVQLPPISELLKSIDRHDPPLHSAPPKHSLLHKQNIKTSEIDSDYLAVLARAKPGGYYLGEDQLASAVANKVPGYPF